MTTFSEHANVSKEYPDLYPLTVAIMSVILGITIGFWLFGRDQTIFDGNLLSFATNLWTEGVSITVTIFILDRLNARRAKEDRKLELFRQAKSRSNQLAIDAVDQIKHDKFWDKFCDYYKSATGKIALRNVLWMGADLSNSHLENAHLRRANLKSANCFGANLKNANLSTTNLEDANLEFADLHNANLKNAYLKQAKLKETKLSNADLSGSNFENANLNECDISNAKMRKANFKNARLLFVNLDQTDASGSNFENVILYEGNFKNADLYEVNFKNAILSEVHLENASLIRANLEDADLSGAHLEKATLKLSNLRGVKRIETATFSEETILPDGSNWTPETDMTRYTNPEHPDFWEPEWAKVERKSENET